MTDHSPVGDTLESLLEETGDREVVYCRAVKEVIAWQLEEARKAGDVSKTAMAEALRSSRSQVDRILDPENVAVSLDLLARAAQVLGKRLKVELVDAD